MNDLLQLSSTADNVLVVGVDGSDSGRRALMWAAREARVRSVALRLVHAWAVPAVALSTAPGATAFIDPTVFETDAVRLVGEVVADLRAAFGPDCPNLETSVVQGDPIGVLADAAASAALLVVGSHGRGAVASTLLGSVAEGCLRHAGTPVAVVRADAHLGEDAPVVVGVDDSEGARAALEWAVLEAGRRRSRLLVVHAQPDATVAEPEVPGSASGESGRRFLDHLLATVAVIVGRPRSVAWRVSTGDPADVLVEASRSAALLVVGEPHPHGLRERLVGSTGRRCVREAACPVVVVPAGVDSLDRPEVVVRAS